MPKLSSRCHRFGRCHGGSVAGGSVAIMVPPRKVSFEDGHQDAAGSAPPAATATATITPSSAVITSSRSTLPVLKEEPESLSSRKATLIRPTTSKCLVELAKSVDEVDEAEDVQVATGHQRNSSPSSSSSSWEDVAPVSPVPQNAKKTHISSPKSNPPSPDLWGHFVDMMIPCHEQINRVASFSPYHRHDAPCSCSSCRRRRSCPYGDYKKKKSRRPLCFLQDLDEGYRIQLLERRETQALPTVPSDLPRTKLAARKESIQRQPTENLIHTFRCMRVD